MSFAKISDFDDKHQAMSLEPRLQEYITKKKYYTDNDIAPSVPLEKEFQITSLDIKIIKAHFRGEKDIYGKVAKMYSHNSSSKKSNKFEFPSKELLKDPRVQKLKEGHQAKTEEIPVNRGMFAPDKRGRFYEDEDININNNKMMDARDFPEFVYDNRGFTPSTEKYRVAPNPYNRSIDPDPRNKYIISDLDNREKYGTYSDMDVKHKVVIPNMGQSKSELDYSNYRMKNYFSDDQNDMDAQIETELVRGSIAGRMHNRSAGYRNSEENYFDYIDNSNPAIENWVRGGDATRLDNKTLAKNRTYRRDIL